MKAIEFWMNRLARIAGGEINLAGPINEILDQEGQDRAIQLQQKMGCFGARKVPVRLKRY